jgi:hypothetical protein
MSASWSGPVPDRELREPAGERRATGTCVTAVWVPYFGDSAVQRLHAPVNQPGSEPEAESNPDSLWISESARPGPEVVPELEASL